MSITHLTEHEYAFLNANNIVENIAVFAEDAHNDAEIQAFAELNGFIKSICCRTFGKPYMGDTWDEANKVWIQTAPRIIPLEVTE
jgi:hypothetical protein